MRQLMSSLPPSPGRPAWSLSAYLAIALLLRLPAVLLADGFEFVDQQYQYVDPAWSLATGQVWHPTWEWHGSMRSHAYPLLLAQLFRLLVWLGCDEPLATLRWVRLVHAVFGLLPLWAFWCLVVRWRPLAQPRPALLLAGLCGLLVASVQPSGPSVSATLVATAGLLLAGPRHRHALAAGLCLGFAFCARFQDALFGPAFLLVLLFQRRGGAAVWFALGCLPGILAQGLVDHLTVGEFLATPWHYVYGNLVLGAAAKWRTQPFWYYWLLGALPVVLLLPWPGLWQAGLQRVREGFAAAPAAMVGALWHLLVHSFVARKSMRFEYPALVLLLLAIAAARVAPGRAARWHLGLLFVVQFGFWCYASLWFHNAGAVRLALWCRDQPDNTGTVLVVGGDATSLGGFYHWRPAMDGVAAIDLASFDDTWARDRARYARVIAVREPLPEPAAAGLELVASFSGMFDARTGDRRFVYRRRD